MKGLMQIYWLIYCELDKNKPIPICMLRLIVTSDGQLAFQFEDNGIIPVIGVGEFFGVPAFISFSDQPIYPY
jgi:hypothetical protein